MGEYIKIEHNGKLGEFARHLIGKRVTDLQKIGDTTVLIFLDDGTELELITNEGGWSGEAGDYIVKSTALIGGVIMRAESICTPNPDNYTYETQPDLTYQLFVYTDKVPAGGALVTMTGSDGSGYYGTGYEITVTREED